MIKEQESRRVRQNVVWSVIDYLSQPALMVVAAPVLLKTLGAPEYGAWMLVNSIVATTSGLGGGFGDSAIRFISMYRGRDDQEGVARSLVAALVVNCALGFLLAMALVVSAPLLIASVFHVEPVLRHGAVIAVRISAFVLLVRFAAVVFTSAIRGYERYRPVVVTSVGSRILIVRLAVLLATKGFGLVAVLWTVLGVEGMTLIAQAILAWIILDVRKMSLVDIHAGVRELSGFGVFTWLKSAMGVLFSYADRLMVAALLGTGPLAFFVLCNQLTQPIPALLVSGFNFIFPNFSARTESGRWTECRKSYRKAVLVSVFIVAAIGLPLIMMARNILALWLGPAALKYENLLIVMTVGNSLLAISVVPHYAALALGKARALACINLVTGVVSLAGGYALLRHIGLLGGGFARVIAGVISLYVFAIVHSVFKQTSDSSHNPSLESTTVTSLDPVSS